MNSVSDSTLGRPIIWHGMTMGYTGDFNGNGKEELYLYEITGLQASPRCLEFNQTGFIAILDVGRTQEATVSSIDAERKAFIIKKKKGVDNTTLHSLETYKWDTDTQRYEILPEETKEWKITYRWDPYTETYEVVPDETKE